MKRLLRPIGLILVMLTTQGGCLAERESNARLVDYTLVGEERTIHPETGETIITSHWEYEDGVTTTTVKIVPRGTEARRGERTRPAPRVAD